MGIYRLKTSFGTDVLGVLVNTWLNTNKQGILAMMKVSCTGGCVSMSAC